ncbi:hypothetical protein ACSLBF_05215 [Pseudoalteromonas sp. T1lg65]|uniref:hypothetical protein n=1 Tax=Pseudoalteromonas sp. T1lg65 TaxID=2077101 RepID=UPI003F7AE7CB
MISQAFILLHPSGEFDSNLIAHLQSKKHPVLLISAAKHIVDEYPRIENIEISTPITELQLRELLNWFEINAAHQEVAILHCANRVNEAELLAEPHVGKAIVAQLERVFGTLNVLADSLRLNGGNLVFLTQSDTQNYELEATSSVCNHAQNALMMTLAREYQGSKFAVNSFVLPLLATDSKTARTEKRKLKGGILGARPAVFSYHELAEYLVNFLKTNTMLTGQSIAFTPTLELKL